MQKTETILQPHKYGAKGFMSFKDYKRGAGRLNARQFNVLELAKDAGMPMWSNAHRNYMRPERVHRLNLKGPKAQAIIKRLEEQRLLRVEKKSKD